MMVKSFQELVVNLTETACDADAWYYDEVAMAWRCEPVERIVQMQKDAGVYYEAN